MSHSLAAEREDSTTRGHHTNKKMLLPSYSFRWFCCRCCCGVQTEDCSRHVEAPEEEFQFVENSHQMYVDVVNLSPKPFRRFARAAYKKSMHKHAFTNPDSGQQNVINEAIMYTVVKEATPKKYLKRALETLDKDRTTTKNKNIRPV